MKYAYIRVSTKDQNIDRQVEAMKEAGIDKSKMFIDKQSGKDFERKNYKKMCILSLLIDLAEIMMRLLNNGEY